jgi:hypothetical protein
MNTPTMILTGLLTLALALALPAMAEDRRAEEPTVKISLTEAQLAVVQKAETTVLVALESKQVELLKVTFPEVARLNKPALSLSARNLVGAEVVVSRDLIAEANPQPSP